MDSEPEVLRKIFETNFFGLTETTRVFLPLLKQGVTPAIVNISSVVGKRRMPARSLYSSSKFAVAGFSEAIRAELAKDGIDVIVVSPGLTQTNFSKNMLEQKAKMQLDHMRGMTSEEVAVATLRAIERGSADVTLTLQGQAARAREPLLPVVRGLEGEEEDAQAVRRGDRRAEEEAGRTGRIRSMNQSPEQPMKAYSSGLPSR